MSTKMIHANKRVFSLLSDRLPEEVIHHLKLNEERYIATDDEEKEFLKHSKVRNTTLCIPGKLVLFIECQGHSFVVVPEKRAIKPFMSGLVKQHNDNAGLLTVIWGMDHSVKSVDEVGYEIAQKVFGVSGAFEVESLRDYYHDCDIWEVDPKLFQPSDLSNYRIYASYLIEANCETSSISLDYSDETLFNIRCLLDEDSSALVGEVVFRGLTATHWQHAFLDFYRCFERLYPVTTLKDVCSALGGKTCPERLAIELKRFTGWKPRDDESLLSLLATVKEKSLIKLIKHLSSEETAKESDLSALAARRIYRLRNEIAHWRSSRNYEPAEWDCLICTMCEMLTDLHRTHN